MRNILNGSYVTQEMHRELLLLTVLLLDNVKKKKVETLIKVH